MSDIDGLHCSYALHARIIKDAPLQWAGLKIHSSPYCSRYRAYLIENGKYIKTFIIHWEDEEDDGSEPSGSEEVNQ